MLELLIVVAVVAVPGFLSARTLFRWACVHYRHS